MIFYTWDFLLQFIDQIWLQPDKSKTVTWHENLCIFVFHQFQAQEIWHIREAKGTANNPRIIWRHTDVMVVIIFNTVALHPIIIT